MTRDELDESVKTWLAGKTVKPVYLIDVPTGAATPHYILYPLGAPGRVTSFDGNMQDLEFRYQVTSVGVDPKQASWLSSKALEFLTAIEQGMVINGVNITMRWNELLGPPRKSGDRLFTVDDTYVLRTGFSGI